MYYSTKTYGHERGLSCCFRQWRATSHCNLLHGYALSFRFVFSAEVLDECNWVMDFGGLKELEETIKALFDHKTVIAEDDPYLDELTALAGLSLADVVVVPVVGCEAFAQIAYSLANEFLVRNKLDQRVKIHEVEVKEHGANGAIYNGECSE